MTDHLQARRVADARFLASSDGPRVRLLGDLPGWREALAASGAEVVDDDGADLVVASRPAARAATAIDAPAVVVLGPATGPLRRAGLRVQSVLVRPGLAGPRLLVPADARGAAAHALLAPIEGRPPLRRLLTKAVLAGVRAGVPWPQVVTVGQRDAGPPAFLAEAAKHATVPTAGWSLLAGDGDDLQRMVWRCFEPGASEPTVVVKCSRVPGNDDAFRRDADALALLAPLPATLRGHAPEVLARFTHLGLPASVERAATGQPLHQVLDAAVVVEVAEWIEKLGVATAAAGALDDELGRLATEVVPRWTDAGATTTLVTRLPHLPAVLQHGDLGCWNVLSGPGGFTVVDWESARSRGLPLWDLVYFLADAWSTEVRPRTPEAKERAVVQLLRGHLPRSQDVFERVARAAGAVGVPLDAVGPIVTLGWLHHGLSAEHRRVTGGALGATTAGAGDEGPLQQLAGPWLQDAELGPSWSAFERWRAG